MKASVIVCTYNRAPCLQNFLSNFTKIRTRLSDFEIILIDDGSTDETESVITQFLEILPIKHYKFKKNLGKEQAVFFGISKAESKNLLFTDDDCLVDSKWIDAMVMELGSFPLVAGRITTATNTYRHTRKEYFGISPIHGFCPIRIHKFSCWRKHGN